MFKLICIRLPRLKKFNVFHIILTSIGTFLIGVICLPVFLTQLLFRFEVKVYNNCLPDEIKSTKPESANCMYSNLMDIMLLLPLIIIAFIIGYLLAEPFKLIADNIAKFALSIN